MKNPPTLAGIEAATFQFVAQHLNHCATAVPHVCSTLCIFAEEGPVPCSNQRSCRGEPIGM